jgi:hypothetical protein
LDPEAANYNAFAIHGKANENELCDCPNGYLNEDEHGRTVRRGSEVCKLKETLPMVQDFQVAVVLREDSGGLARSLNCLVNGTGCGCPLPVERDDGAFVLHWTYPEGKVTADAPAEEQEEVTAEVTAEQAAEQAAEQTSFHQPDAFYIDVIDGSNDNVKTRFTVPGTARHFVVNMTLLDHRNSWHSTSFAPQIYTLSKNVEITPIKHIGQHRTMTSLKGNDYHPDATTANYQT